LVSEIGHTDDLKAAGITPFFDSEPLDKDKKTKPKLQLAKKICCNLPVGRNSHGYS